MIPIRPNGGIHKLLSCKVLTMELYIFLKNYNVHCTVSKYTAKCLKMARASFLNIQDFNF